MPTVRRSQSCADNLLAFLCWLHRRCVEHATPVVELITSEEDAGKQEPEQWNREELLDCHMCAGHDEECGAKMRRFEF